MKQNYYYLQLDLIGISTPLEVRQAVQAACASVFGETGAALPLDVLSTQHTPSGLYTAYMAVSRYASGPGGKDVVLLAAAEALSAPARVSLPEPAPAPGLVLPDGSINWGCPCLGGMATGPCAQPFRDAFSCFHYSEADPKGSDCYDKFSDMQACMADFPELYAKDDEEEPPAFAPDEPAPAAADAPGPAQP